jgi:hypothetical protein
LTHKEGADAERVSVRAIRKRTDRPMWLYESTGDETPANTRVGSGVLLAMASPLLLQFSIALLTGMVAATFVPPVRKAIPRAVEVGLWIALVTVCLVGVMSVTDTNARNLSTSALWGADQVIGTILGVLLGSAGTWMAENRFAIGSWLIVVAGADIFCLMLLGSIRSAAPWRPRVRLREWMELPPPARGLAPTPVVADALAGANRRLTGAGAVLAAAALVRTRDLSVRARDTVRDRRFHEAARVGVTGSRARLESLQDALAQVRFAARSWYAAAGQPAVGGVAERAGAVRSLSARAARRGLHAGAGWRPGHVIDIRALTNAPTIGWYGGLSAAPGDTTRGEDDATDEPQRPDTLAS